MRRLLANNPERERSRSPEPEEPAESPPADDSEVLLALPIPGTQTMDLDFQFWVLPVEDIQEFSKDFVLSNWFWKINPLGSGTRTIQVTDPPHMVRLLPWNSEPGECRSITGKSRAERKTDLAQALCDLGRKVSPRNFTGCWPSKGSVSGGKP